MTSETEEPICICLSAKRAGVKHHIGCPEHGDPHLRMTNEQARRVLEQAQRESHVHLAKDSDDEE